jgi:lipopolysaccharide assembly outer membrane protein LptD (OstA)
VTLCSPGQHGCDRGSLLLRADSVDYDEKTGELNAVGGVRIGPYRNQPDNSSR